MVGGGYEAPTLSSIRIVNKDKILLVFDLPKFNNSGGRRVGVLLSSKVFCLYKTDRKRLHVFHFFINHFTNFNVIVSKHSINPCLTIFNDRIHYDKLCDMI